MTPTHPRFFCSFFFALLLTAAPVLDAEQAASGGSAEKALALAEKAWQRVLDSDAVSLRLSTMFEVKTAEGMQEMESSYDVFMQRPNRFAMISLEGDISETFVSDGKQAVVYFPMTEKYHEAEAPESMEELLDFEHASTGGGLPARGFLAPFFSADAFQKVREAVEDAEYLGKKEGEEGDLHQLALVLRSDSTEWPEEMAAMRDMALRFEVDLRGDGEAAPLVEGIHLDMTDFIRATMSQMVEEHPEMAEMFKEMEMNYTFTFSDWSFPGEIDPARFAFTPPAGAERVENPEDIFGMPETGREQASHELLGAPAPLFELEFLDGSPARLSDHLGQNVIVLDFWATWCGPCIQAMPALIEVTEKYRDQGVVFWAVNLRETPEQVRKFIEAREWDLTVPMDAQGRVANQYQVTGIPQTVIIGKDGNVQAVHVGFSPRLRETLPAELETLLTGESLLPEPDQKPGADD